MLIPSSKVFLFLQHMGLFRQKEGSGNIGTFVADAVEHSRNGLHAEDDGNRFLSM